ncbi:MAG: glycoside hydrolase family 43 protein [Chitinophagaceae bacterium]|nr:glycoside hydrolase family 43 protein [Chitinophagaceae bacterium]
MLVSNCSKSSGGASVSIPPVTDSTVFTNPLLPSGPDPWVVYDGGNYYYTHTFGDRLAIYKTRSISELRKATPVTIWPSSGSTNTYSKNIWAPELHRVNGNWYMYFAADDGDNRNHRMFVLENTSPDPLAGTWTFKGKITDASDKWAIDGSVFQLNNQLYFIWSGWEGDTDVSQNIYIAKMSDPVTISSERVLISAPTYGWEKNGAPPAVNEGPEFIKGPTGKAFITFSASGCWTDDYALGLLTLIDGGDPMKASDWQKTATPIFTKSTTGSAYGPGHNGFFKSPDGTEDWIIYHANTSAGQGCGNVRSPRIQSFTWNTDGTPNFGLPVPINMKIKKPKGE